MATAVERRERARAAVKKIGLKVLDNPSQFLDTVILSGCMYLGYNAIPKTASIPLKLTFALSGGIGYKLATSGGETSSLAGLGILASLGLIGSANSIQGWLNSETARMKSKLGQTYLENPPINVNEAMKADPEYEPAILQLADARFDKFIAGNTNDAELMADAVSRESEALAILEELRIKYGVP